MNTAATTKTKFEPDDATDQDARRLSLIGLLTGVWQFDEIIKLERVETDTHHGWQSTVAGY